MENGFRHQSVPRPPVVGRYADAPAADRLSEIPCANSRSIPMVRYA